MFTPSWIRACISRCARLGLANPSRPVARPARRSRSYRPAFEELECRRLLSASILHLEADFSQAHADGVSSANLAAQAAREYVTGLVEGDPSQKQQASQDWAGAQAAFSQFRQDLQSIRDDLSLKENLESAISSRPKDERMRAGVFELIEGSFEDVEGRLKDGIELGKKGLQNYFKPIDEQIQELFRLAPEPTTSPHASHHHQSTIDQTSLPLVPEGPIVSSAPNQQIFFNENAPGGPPGRPQPA